MTPPELRLATRASPLALWQARWVAGLLRRRHPGVRVRLVPIVSSGDRDRATALYDASTVGMFVKEIQAAVLAGEADAGVHSCKDLPTTLPAGLALAAVPRRADPRDCLVGAPSLAALPEGAMVGSSSLRRRLQLARLRPDLRFAPIRGNIDTRLRKIRSGELAATVLACAGLQRLGLLRAAAAVPFDPVAELSPAPAQGAVAIDCRAGDRRARWLLAGISDRDSLRAVAIERAVLAAFAGGCSLPLGCWARRDGGAWRVTARLCRDGGSVREADHRGASADAPGAVTRALLA
jgi:hydroxymethylbilane synthase